MFFFWTHKMKPKNNEGCQDSTWARWWPWLFATCFRFLASWSRIGDFFLGKNSLESSSQQCNSEILHLQILRWLADFWYSKLSFFQIGLMSFDFLSFGADFSEEVFSMNIFRKKVSPTYMRWSNIHPRVLIKSWWSYKNVRPQSCGICWTVWRSAKADDVGDLRFWALGFPMSALFFGGS